MIRGMMSGGASVEDTLELWASSLRDVKGRIRRLFTQDRVAASASDFLDALPGNKPRKTGDADALRDVVCGTMWLSIWLPTMQFS